MPKHKFTSETARAAGAKGGGPQQKTKHWNQLRDFMLEQGATRVMKYLNSLEDEDEFFQKYERLLNYFAPKMSSAQIDTKADINIQVKEPDWGADD